MGPETALASLRELGARPPEACAPSTLVATALDAAIETLGAERGFMVRAGPPDVEGNRRITVVVARGFGGEALMGRPQNVSRTVIDRVLERRQTLATSNLEDRHFTEVPSIRENHVLSILCLPHCRKPIGV